MELYRLLRTLTETPGPSGSETAVAEAVRRLWASYVDELTVDRLGSLIAVKRGSPADQDGQRRRILVAAHMDEIALMVKQIEAHGGYGFLRLTNVGGVDIRHLYGQIVTVHASRQGGRSLTGVVGSLPGSMLPSDRSGAPNGYDDVLVDVGLPEDEVRSLVAIGDYITFRQPMRKLLNKRVAGKAMDNRASVAAVTVALEYLQQRRHSWDVVAVATVQEETRLLGAYTSAHAQQPDVAVALDVTFARGPGTSNESGAYELGGGPAIGLGVNVHPGVYEALNKAAAALEMKVHTEPHGRYSGTDAFALQIAREGIPTGLIGIPLRYMHTTVETVALDDIERAGRLLGEFIARLDDRFLDELAANLLDD